MPGGVGSDVGDLGTTGDDVVAMGAAGSFGAAHVAKTKSAPQTADDGLTMCLV
jgi:hypothetical protein